MIRIFQQLSTYQFQQLSDRLRAAHPEWRTADKRGWQVQLLRGEHEVRIQPLGKYVLPDGVEAEAKKIIATLLAAGEPEVEDADSFAWMRQAQAARRRK